MRPCALLAWMFSKSCGYLFHSLLSAREEMNDFGMSAAIGIPTSFRIRINYSRGGSGEVGNLSTSSKWTFGLPVEGGTRPPAHSRRHTAGVAQPDRDWMKALRHYLYRQGRRFRSLRISPVAGRWFQQRPDYRDRGRPDGHYRQASSQPPLGFHR